MIAMPNLFLSVSCEECSTEEFSLNEISCSVKISVLNTSDETLLYNFECIFYADVDKNREVVRFRAFPGSVDLAFFTVDDNISAEAAWTSRGLSVSAGQFAHVMLWPSLSPSAGLLCAVPYTIEINSCSAPDSKTGGCHEEELEILSTERWTCNCRSIRWDPRFEQAPINIRDLVRWKSSGEGLSDTRITETVNTNNLNPVIKIKSNFTGVILYQTNRFEEGSGFDPELYKIYASAFSLFPASNMYATGAEAIISPFSQIVHHSDIPICENQGCFDEDNNRINSTILGRNPIFSIDQYDNIFLATEQQLDQTECQEFFKDKQQIVKVHSCGASEADLVFDKEPEGVGLQGACDASSIINEIISDPGDPLFNKIVRAVRINNEDVKYHITRNQKPSPVVDKCSVRLTFIGAPDATAVRLRNGQKDWSVWMPFDPEVGENTIEVPWELSPRSGIKTVSVQAATNAGLSASAIITVIADYTKISFDVKFFRSLPDGTLPPNEVTVPFDSNIFVDDNLVGSLEGIPITVIRVPVVEDNEIVRRNRDYVYIEIIPDQQYLAQFTDQEKSSNEKSPVFDFLTQGVGDSFSLPSFYTKRTDGLEVFRGVIEIGREDGRFKDGLSSIIPHFKNDCSDASSFESMPEYVRDKYNIISTAESTTEVVDPWKDERDKYGKVKHQITIRPSEDPYFVFGDPNYRLNTDE